jgi:dynein heavy chain
MQENLIKLQPELKRAAEQTEIKMKEVAIKKAEADILKSSISGEEKIVADAVSSATAIKEDCNRELELALPDLRAAEDAVKCINKSEIDTVKKFTNPNQIIKLVLKGLVLILDPNPKETMKDEKTLKNVTNWWVASVRILGDNLVKKLEEFRIDLVEEKTISNLGKFLNDPENAKDLDTETVANASQLMVAILKWIKGTHKYYYVNKRINPMKEALAKAEK